MWRYDAGRTAYSPEEIPAEVHLLWVREYTPRTPVWEDPLNRDLMPFDRVFEPIVVGDRLIMGFNDADKVVALDTDTGHEKWIFRTEGPVRLAPAAGRDRVYFGCDDGYLYCLKASDGALVWRFRGGPSDQKVLGNGRLISMWPVRGGPVLADGIVYFAAGIWPFMGIFIYALDADTGSVIWRNDRMGSQYMVQPHGAPAFGGVAPQGAFVVSGDRLLVPGGRSVPACFDRTTGNFLYYRHAEFNKTGGAFVCAIDEVFFNHHREGITFLYDVAKGELKVRPTGRFPVLTHAVYYVSGDKVMAFDAARIRDNPKAWAESKLWEIDADASGDLIGAGGHLYAAGNRRITAIELPQNAAPPRVVWTKTVNGDVQRLLAADGNLFAVTLDGDILAFGGKKGKPVQLTPTPGAVEPPAGVAQRAAAIIQQTGVRDGYALLYGVGNGNLLEALVAQSDLHIIAVEPDTAKAAAAKKRMDLAGVYGGRSAVHHGDPLSFKFPPYCASLTIVDDAGATAGPVGLPFLQHVYYSMRPYGGKAWIGGLAQTDRDRLCRAAEEASLSGLEVREIGDALILSREGPLPGSASWTHHLGDISQSGKSNDDLVKLPLGLLWFGGNTHDDVLPRHGHGPSPQVIGGRLFIQGLNCMSARDVYTGRVLWKKMMHDLGTYGVYFDGTYRDTPTDTAYNQVHIPGSNVRGTNFVAVEDGVYVIQGGTCHRLDPATGETMHVFSLPPKDPTARRPVPSPWGYIGIYEDVLIAGCGLVAFSDLIGQKKDEYTPSEDFDKAASQKLIVMDRTTGDVQWEQDSRHGFLHNGIAVGNGMLFCLDKLPPHIESRLERRGRKAPTDYRLMALDMRTGQPRWETTKGIFGSFLCYSQEHDILLQATRPSRDSGAGETGERMVAYKGQSGDVLWNRSLSYPTFPLLHHDRFITEAGVFDLMTGEPCMRSHPLTGEQLPWTWKREYGCNYPIAAEHLLTFRSGAAGFYDLDNDGGTGNFGGFRSGCSANLIAADGVLNAPDYTRTCSCSYQNQASLALVHLPDVEIWTYNNFEAGSGRIRRVGINLGAPGDRRAPGGTLWLDFPSVGGPSPDISVRTRPEKPEWFYQHSAWLRGDGLKWVAASGVKGITSIALTLAPGVRKSSPYTVRLHFAELDGVGVGERVFDLALQGQPVLQRFDIVAEAGEILRPVVKEFRGIRVQETLAIDLKKSDPNKTAEPVLCGIEVAAEGE